MGDAFGSSLQRTPRTGLADAISNLMYQSIFGGAANSGDPRFDQFLRAFAGQQQPGMGAPGYQLPPGTQQPVLLPGQQPGAGTGQTPTGAPYPGAGIPYQPGGVDPILMLLGQSAPAMANLSGDDPENDDGIEPPPPGGPQVPVPNQDPTQWPIDPDTGQPTPPPVGGPGGPPGTPAPTQPGTATGPGSFRLGDFIQQMFSLPQYGGQMTAGMNSQQNQALQGAEMAGSQFFNQQGPMSQQILQQLLGRGMNSGLNVPPEIANLLQGGQGQNILSQIGMGGGPGGSILQQLSQPQNLGQNLLQQLAGQSPFDQSALSNLQNLAQGGGQQDYNNLFNAISQAQQGAFQRNARDIREQFSGQGLRQGTDLANALATAGTENANNIGAQLAQLGLQSAGSQNQTRLGAAQSLGQLGLGARGQTGDILSQFVNANLAGQGQQLNAGQILQQMGLGAGQGLTQAGTQGADILSQLFGGQQGQSLAALQSLPGAQQTLSQLPLQYAQGLFGLGEAARGIQDTGLQRALAEFQRTQAALYPGIVNYASGAPIIQSQGVGSQLLGAGSTLGAAALGGK